VQFVCVVCCVYYSFVFVICVCPLRLWAAVSVCVRAAAWCGVLNTVCERFLSVCSDMGCVLEGLACFDMKGGYANGSVLDDRERDVRCM
jgi:hypothetical protein